MLRLDKFLKPWKESAELCDHINLYGFWNDSTFLTKSGDLGMVLAVTGVDYESLDYDEQEYAVKRLEAALKNFGSGFRVYQYLFKTNHPDIPFADYEHPIVQAGVDRRRQLFQGKADRLFETRKIALDLGPHKLFYSFVTELGLEFVYCPCWIAEELTNGSTDSRLRT